ncbi:MAG: RNA 3'-terminal phosphate cyclase [Thaumarchaeota archaeon]|nr:RNA 3'-terminal phosphate cyclase [Nitrososphaerota archaeon]
MDVIAIDGSYGEGGGQILRTAVGLSVATGQSIEVFNIRANRPVPGLKAQHLWAVKSAAELCSGKVDCLREGSTAIKFQPQKPKNENLKFDIGTAGSITLLLQALIPAVSRQKGEFRFDVKGGTDVKWSPTLDYFRHIVIPLYSQIGVEVSLEVRKRGFYPVGGGDISCKITAKGYLNNIALKEKTRGKASIASVCSNLPKSIAERQLKAAEDFLISNNVEVEGKYANVESAASPGSAICVYFGKGSYIGGDSIGERAKPSEKVGFEAAKLFFDEYSSDCTLDSHVADMVVPLLALAKNESVFVTSKRTEHLLTNLHIAKMITECEYSVEQLDSGASVVRITPK